MTTRLDLSKLDLMDALDLAVLIEAEAYDRYELFVGQVRGRCGARGVFASMAENEAKHGLELAKRRRALFGDKLARVSLDDLFDVQAPDHDAPRRDMSAQRAFEIALHDAG